jgi:hypothetical protein
MGASVWASSRGKLATRARQLRPSKYDEQEMNNMYYDIEVENLLSPSEVIDATQYLNALIKDERLLSLLKILSLQCEMRRLKARPLILLRLHKELAKPFSSARKRMKVQNQTSSA